MRPTFTSLLLAPARDCFYRFGNSLMQPFTFLAKSPFALPTAHIFFFFVVVGNLAFCFYCDGNPFLQEASSALAEVLPKDVASSLVHLWHAAMAGTQLSAFCDILEQQVAVIDAVEPLPHEGRLSSGFVSIFVGAGILIDLPRVRVSPRSSSRQGRNVTCAPSPMLPGHPPPPRHVRLDASTFTMQSLSSRKSGVFPKGSPLHYYLYDAHKVFTSCNLVGRRLDKRRERQLVAERQRALKESLFRSVSGAAHTGPLPFLFFKPIVVRATALGMELQSFSCGLPASA